MKRFAIWASIVMAMILVAGSIAASAQATFKIPFEFKAVGKKIPAGEYWLGLSGEGQLLLRQISAGKELLIPFTEKLPPPDQPAAEPRLIFDEVGDFAPSYTEYFTVYVLSEVWLSAEEGFLVHTTKGAHKERTVTGVRPEK